MHIPIRCARRDTGRTVQLNVSHRPNTENVMSTPDLVPQCARRDTGRTVQLHVSHRPNTEKCNEPPDSVRPRRDTGRGQCSYMSADRPNTKM